jgi:plastocyanin
MILTVVAMLAAAAAPAPVAASAPVAVTDRGFRPRALTIRRGRAVTWAWTGRRRHDVYFVSGPRRGRPRSCARRRSGTCTRRFPVAGTYGYVCTLHGTMTGRVSVR